MSKSRAPAVRFTLRGLRRILLRLGLYVTVIALVFALLCVLFPPPPVKPYSLVVKDRYGQFLHAFLAPDGVWRLRTSPDEIPKRLKTILISREDKWFYYHPGVNPFSIVRALVQNMHSGRRISGASTITMQIARMLEPKRRTYLNKLVEMFRAFQLELKYSKEELLEIYLSMVPLGGNIEGLRSASMMYYQTPLERLNIAQVFDLILIPSNPNGLRPDQFPERLLGERKRQSVPWIDAGLFTELDSVIIWNTPAQAERQQLVRNAPHFALRVREKVRSRSEVRSSLDLRIQKTAERLLTNHLRPWKLKDVQNGAVVIIDNKTRELVGYVGSEDFESGPSQGQVDAVKALRSPGSTLKPFLYALRMEEGVLTSRTRLLDTPYDAEGFLAENYDGTYSGLVYADDALRRSLNVPLTRMLKEQGIVSFVGFLESAGFASIHSQGAKLGLSLILGGCGVTLEELTAAYAAFPGGGVYVPARYLAVGEEPPAEGRVLFSPSSAWTVTEILAGLDRPDLPNNFQSALNFPRVAFKTGTSYGRRDAWSIGFSSEYTVGVWIGNVSNTGNADLMGGKTAAPLLVDIFNSITSTHQNEILPMPTDIKARLVCAKSGLMPTTRCRHLIEDFCSKSRSLNRACEVCREYFVSMDRRISFCVSCLGSNDYRTVTYESYAPELINYWQKVGIRYTPPPPHNPMCSRTFEGKGPIILSPSESMTYFLASSKQKLVCQAGSTVDILRHTWYIDDRYVGRRKTGDKIFVTLGEGEHIATCLDEKGRVSSVHFRVKYLM